MKFHLYLLLFVSLVLSGCSSLTGTPIEDLGISLQLPKAFSLTQSEETSYYTVTNSQGIPIADIYDITGAEEGSFEGDLAANPTREGAHELMMSYEDVLYRLTHIMTNKCDEPTNYVVEYEEDESFFTFGLCKAKERLIYCGTYDGVDWIYRGKIAEVCKSVKVL